LATGGATEKADDGLKTFNGLRSPLDAGDGPTNKTQQYKTAFTPAEIKTQQNLLQVRVTIIKKAMTL